MTKNMHQEATSTMRVESPAFGHEERIPSKYTCDGEDISPPLAINNAPNGTVSFVVIVDDPDAPSHIWDHWVLFNIPATTTRLGEGTKRGGTSGINSWGRLGYGGPCPPSGEHRYLFRVYALDTSLRLPEGATKTTVIDALQGHVLEKITLMGRYSREIL